jgi:hypothetical protein
MRAVLVKRPCAARSAGPDRATRLGPDDPCCPACRRPYLGNQRPRNHRAARRIHSVPVSIHPPAPASFCFCPHRTRSGRGYPSGASGRSRLPLDGPTIQLSQESQLSQGLVGQDTGGSAPAWPWILGAVGRPCPYGGEPMALPLPAAVSRPHQAPFARPHPGGRQSCRRVRALQRCQGLADPEPSPLPTRSSWRPARGPSRGVPGDAGACRASSGRRIVSGTGRALTPRSCCKTATLPRIKPDGL